MEAAFVKELSNYYPVVDEPGEGVVRLRTALVDISSMLVYKAPAHIAARRTIDSKPGGATLETEAVDSVTEERILAIIGSTNSFVQTITDNPLVVHGSA